MFVLARCLSYRESAKSNEMQGATLRALSFCQNEQAKTFPL